MKVYVIRHGQTDWNLAQKTQGKTDIELNKTGIEQARKAKEKINKCKIDLIYCSPLKRAKETAKIVNEDKKYKIIYEKDLEERGFGDFEGKTKEEIKEMVGDWEKIHDYKINSNERNIEPIKDVCNRVWNFLDKVKEEQAGKNILIVTHAGVCRAINAYFNGADEEGNIASAKMDNCEVREFEYIER